MDYKKIILEKINNLTSEEFENWIASQSPLDQVEIFKEIKAISDEVAMENSDTDQLILAQEFETKIDEYQEKILDEKVAQLNYEMAVEQRDKEFQKMDETIVGIRAYLIECITTNAPNAPQMQQLANQIIELEKKDGFYNEENWKAIL